MTDETMDTRNVCVRGEFVAKIQVCLQTFEFFRSQTSCVYLDCVVHGQSNKSHIKVSALQASVLYIGMYPHRVPCIVVIPRVLCMS